MSADVIHGDALEVLRAMDAHGVDAVVCDPPAGIAFMGKAWDADKGGRTAWIAWLASVLAECRRVLKPGGHALVWALPRTSHWTGMALEDAGFEVRDVVTHLFGSGFPKSLDVSKAIDKARHDDPAWGVVGAWLREQRTAGGMTARELCAAIGAHGATNNGGAVSNWELGLSCPTWEQWEAMRGTLGFPADMDAEVWRLNGRKGQPGEAWHDREVIGTDDKGAAIWGSCDGAYDITAPATAAARQWAGWGTALKPAAEFWWLARAPMAGTVAATVQRHGTGALNVDACRIGFSDGDTTACAASSGLGSGRPASGVPFVGGIISPPHPAGRWPANVVLSHLDACNGSCAPGCPVAALDAQSGERGNNWRQRKAGQATHTVYGDGISGDACHADTGGASRFFYTAKANRAEREAGLAGLPSHLTRRYGEQGQGPEPQQTPRVERPARNHHPTVKPLALMRWLVRLVTPPGGLVLDPFAGSGTTGAACALEGVRFLGIEQDADYVAIARARIAHWARVAGEAQPTLEGIA